MWYVVQWFQTYNYFVFTMSRCYKDELLLLVHVSEGEAQRLCSRCFPAATCRWEEEQCSLLVSFQNFLRALFWLCACPSGFSAACVQDYDVMVNKIFQDCYWSSPVVSTTKWYGIIGTMKYRLMSPKRKTLLEKEIECEGLELVVAFTLEVYLLWFQKVLSKD